MRLLTSFVLIAATMTGSALAADLAPPSAEIYVDEAAFDWSGLYIGGQVGYGWGKGVVNIPLYATPASDVQVNGLAGGAHFGVNAQFDQFVLGAELAVNLLGAQGNAASGGAGGEQYVIKQSWDASLVARAGFAADRVMVYGLGGVAATALSTNYTPSAGADSNATVWGWTVGAGAEYAITDSLSAGLEYRYTDYAAGNFSHTGPSTADLSAHTVKARLSFHF
ncbi:MAG: outer membrane protein [Devosia sp.]|uniref:outer membrane protein n=1 Tax=Devosia sp. TaxID=1871048 RepID=UPI00339839A9